MAALAGQAEVSVVLWNLRRRCLKWAIVHIWIPQMARDESFRLGVIDWLERSGCWERIEARLAERGY